MLLSRSPQVRRNKTTSLMENYFETLACEHKEKSNAQSKTANMQRVKATERLCIRMDSREINN